MSLQTLHPVSFDEGIILDQTPWPGIDVPDECDYSRLLQIMQPLGAEMLLNAIRTRLYLPPYNNVGWAENAADDKKNHPRAPKISTTHRLLSFNNMDSSRILRMSRAFESTWALAAISTRASDSKRLRIIFRKGLSILPMSVADKDRVPDIPPGTPYWSGKALSDGEEPRNFPMLINTVDGKTIVAHSMIVEGDVEMPAYKAALKHRLIGGSREVNSKLVITFHRGLTT
jgi:methionyl-tRNA formyltransferase